MVPSKANWWSQTIKEMRERFQPKSFHWSPITISVDEDGNLNIEHGGVMPASRALSLAEWIKENFKE